MLRLVAPVALVALVALNCSLGVQAAIARTLTNEQISAKMTALFTEQKMLESLNEVRLLKKEGFIYQPALTVPRITACPVRDRWD